MPLTVELIPDGLPPGRLIVPDARLAGPAAGPVLWVSAEPLAEAEAGRRWADLLTRREETGLWPLLLGTQAPDAGGAGRPWLSGELSPVPAERIGRVDVAGLLQQGWDRFVEEYGDPLDFRPVPAPPGVPEADPDEYAAALAADPAGVRALLTGTGRGPHLGLVIAVDGAEAITACGWPCEAGQEEFPAVLRTWQHRFGVRLCALGPDALTLSVAWPPQTYQHAQLVAAEHFAVCPDLAQEHEFNEYAARLTGAPVWSLWWD